MMLNWSAFDYHPFDGYGRFGRHFVQALLGLGVDVMPITHAQRRLPRWMQDKQGLTWDRLTISCIPPFFLSDCPGRQWIYSMTEGSDLPQWWADSVNDLAERLIVPCEQNREAFARGGVTVPIHVVPGGTCPDEFPLLTEPRPERPYTFLAMADRGARKGWLEVWQAFFKAFDRSDYVRLIVKTRAEPNELIQTIAGSQLDPRISIWSENVEDTKDIFAAADCVVLPSRSEGWGMPHREAAMMGIPTVVNRYAGLDDGHTDEWATAVINTLHPDPIPNQFDDHIVGEWMKADVDELTSAMRQIYDNPVQAKAKAQIGAMWLRQNQTWCHAAKELLKVVDQYG